MEGFKVTTLDYMGFDYGEKYYLDIKKAEHDFYTRLGEVIQNNEDLASAEDLDHLHYSSPWKIQRSVPHREYIVMRANYFIWDEWCTEDGCESDIKQEEIVLEKIEIVA